jgi:hypothetical protein
MAIIKTWLYAWTTNSRFGNNNQPCPICNAPNNDTLRHFYNCTPLTTAARTTLNQPLLPTTRDYFFLSTDYNTQQPNNKLLLQLNAIHIYCITNTYHSIKHNPTNDVHDTYNAHLKRLLQHDTKLVNTLLHAHNTTLYHPPTAPQPHPNPRTTPTQPTTNTPPTQQPLNGDTKGAHHSDGS